ncbi:MAG: nucleoside deaminase [Saprospiraceae bacterium]|nr:nucleoside deaminase [Saprospiraceae bacterium]
MNFSIYSDDSFMRMAMLEAKMAYEQDEVPVGAVIVSKNVVIAKARNSVQQLNDPTAHAELLAISAAAEFLGSKYLNECTLYVTLEPCPMCAGALFWSQMGRVVFATKDEKRGCGLYSPTIYHPKTEVSEGLFADEASLLLKAFFKNKR